MTIARRSKLVASLVLLGGGAFAFTALPRVVLAGDGCGGGGGCCGGAGDASEEDDGDAGHGGVAASPDDSGGHGGHGGHGGAKSDADSAGSGAAKADGLLVDLGNKKCPIMGGDVDGSTWSEWNGLRVGHCCPMCKGKFAKDPAKALDAKKIEWKDAAAAVKKVNDAKTDAEREKALTALKAKWTVVRGAAAAKPATTPAAPQGELLVDLGNAKCPIMGGAPDGSTWSEWNGLRVGHCCPMCKGKFAANPERALDQKKIEWKDAAAAVKKVNDAKTPDERAKALTALKAKWTVVREPAPATPTPPK